MPEITTKDIMTKLDEFAKSVHDCQEVNDRLLKDYDGLDVEQVKKIAEEGSKTFEEVQKLDTQMKAQEKELKESIEAMELLLSKAYDNGNIPDPNEAAYKNDLVKYMRKGTPISDEMMNQNAMKIAAKSLIGVDDAKLESYAKDLVEGSGPDGGYFIQSERSSYVSKRIFESSPVRTVANVLTTQTNEVEILLDDDEAAGGRVGEISSRTDTDTPEVALIKIPVHEYYAQPRATQRMVDDAGFDLENWLIGKVTRKLSRLESTDHVTGSGAAGAKGFLSYSDWTAAGTYTRNAVEQIDSGSNGSFDGDNIIALQNALTEDYQANATWMMRRATFTTVMQLKDSEDRYLLNPMILAQGADKVLLGNPVVFAADMPAAATDSLSIVIADFAEFYTIVDRFGIRVLRDPYTSKPYIRYYTTKRTGGAVTNFEAGKILKLAA